MTTLYRFDGKKFHGWSIGESQGGGHHSYFTSTWQETLAGEVKNSKVSADTFITPKKGHTSEERLAEVVQQKVAKKLRDGYTCEKVATARLSPMLAKPYDAAKIDGKLIAIQPKIDGVRCIVRRESGENVAYSREMRKHPEHIQKMVSNLALADGDYLDGELVLPMDMDNNASDPEVAKSKLFQATVSAVKKKSTMSGLLLYMVYDMVNVHNNQPFCERHSLLQEFCRQQGVPFTSKNPVVKVETYFREGCPEEIESITTSFIEYGYEGAMVRDANSLYAFDKRSDALLKVKRFDDAEFTITGYEYGAGKNSNVITWLLKAPNGETFKAVQSGSDREWSPERAQSAVGKPLTVRYQGLTASGVPRFPIGLVVRDYE